MNARTMMMTVLGGGPLLGLLFGFTMNTSMKPSPEPYWRQQRTVDALPHLPGEPLADTGAHDPGASWDADRMPTWKRGTLGRVAVVARYAPLRNAAYEPEPEPAFDGPDGDREEAYDEPAETGGGPEDAADHDIAPNRSAASSARDAAKAFATPSRTDAPAETPAPAVIPITAGL